MSRRRVAILVPSLCLAGLLAAAVAYRKDLWLEWWRRQAARDAMEEGFDPEKPGRAWKEILDAGEKGFPHLVKLLKDPRYEVWKAAVEVLDLAGEDAAPARFLDHLREQDACGLLLYLIRPPYQELGANVRLGRSFAPWREEGSLFGRGYWTGSVKPLAPVPTALRFLSETLVEEAGADGAVFPFKIRALNALEAMAESQDVDRLITRSALQDADPEVRLHAVHALGRRKGVIDWIRTPTLEDWEQFTDFGKLGPRGLLDLGSHRCLIRVDHIRVLRVLARLHRNTEARPNLDEALQGGDALPLPIPQWFPIHEAARRYLGGPTLQRAMAMAILAETRGAEARGVLADHLEREPDEQLRLLARACLLLMGDASQEVMIRGTIAERMVKAREALLPPPAPLITSRVLSGKAWRLLEERFRETARLEVDDLYWILQERSP